MRLVTLGKLDLYKNMDGENHPIYIMRYDIIRKVSSTNLNELLGHGFYLYNFSRIPAEFECLFLIHYPIVKESVVNE